METIGLEISSVLLLTAILLLHKRGRAGANRTERAHLRRLEEIAESSEMTKQTCLSSLNALHQSLQSLEIRTSSSEKRLGRLIEAPQVERKEQYEAAALLLISGQNPERVANLLNFPVSQVELVQELLKSVIASKKNISTPDFNGLTGSISKSQKKKTASRKSKSRVQPILLTDIVSPEGSTDVLSVDQADVSKGAAA
jgi:hypothetical protein